MGLQHEIIAKTKPTLYHNQRVKPEQAVFGFLLFIFIQSRTQLKCKLIRITYLVWQKLFCVL